VSLVLGSDKEKVEPGAGSALKMASRLFDEGHRRLRFIMRPPKGCLHQCRTRQLAHALHLFFFIVYFCLFFFFELRLALTWLVRLDQAAATAEEEDVVYVHLFVDKDRR
jgi:hypothetical protein